MPRIKAAPRGQGGPIFNRREACCGESGGGGDRGGEIVSGLRNMTGESVNRARGRQSMQCSPSPVTGNGGTPQKVSPERNDEIAFVRGKLLLNPTRRSVLSLSLHFLLTCKVNYLPPSLLVQLSSGLCRLVILKSETILPAACRTRDRANGKGVDDDVVVRSARTLYSCRCTLTPARARSTSKPLICFGRTNDPKCAREGESRKTRWQNAHGKLLHHQ